VYLNTAGAMLDRRWTALHRLRTNNNNILTPREIEVLGWVARGKSAWEIGEVLHIAKRTVDEHVRAAVRKLGAVNRTHAVALALRERIIEL
jgi:LuxR family quorum sensing-dependent transcriptional regulator